MGSQSTAKSIFLLTSMLGWLLIGGALIYAGPLFYDWFAHSDVSQLWMSNLAAGGYNPYPFLKGSGIILGIEIAAYSLWYKIFDKKI